MQHHEIAVLSVKLGSTTPARDPLRKDSQYCKTETHTLLEKSCEQEWMMIVDTAALSRKIIDIIQLNTRSPSRSMTLNPQTCTSSSGGRQSDSRLLD